jgi:hypothetical protein
MILSRRANIFINWCFILSILTFLIKAELNKAVLVLALCLLLLNVYNLVSIAISDDPSQHQPLFKQSTRRAEDSRKPNFDSRQFEEKVKQAVQRNASKQSSYFEEENKYWNNKYFSRSSKIEELRDVRIADLAKDRVARNDDEASLKFEMSTMKKLRNYLESMDTNEEAANIRKIKTVFEGKLKQPSISEERIKQCLRALEQHINAKVSSDYDGLISDFNAVDRFLHKCFSLSLSVQPCSSASSISYSELLELARAIELKDVIPTRYTPNFTPLQVKKELAVVKEKILRLPNFSFPPNILRLHIFLKQLRREFEEENIVFSSLDQERLKEDGSNHLFKFQDNNRLYYNKVSSIKTNVPSTIVFLFLLEVWDKYKRTSKGLIRDLRSLL